MENFILGFLTGGSLILAIGPQNLFVIEQGLKRNFIFTITTICAASDILLIFLGIFIYNIFDAIPLKVEIILNVILVLFLSKYILDKFKNYNKIYKVREKNKLKEFKPILFKTLGFTYLNPHVYSDTVFILGNLSKNFELNYKLQFALGASLASILFFYSLGYLSSIFANIIKRKKIWKYINVFIIMFMSIIIIYIIFEIYFKLLL